MQYIIRHAAHQGGVEHVMLLGVDAVIDALLCCMRLGVLHA